MLINYITTEVLVQCYIAIGMSAILILPWLWVGAVYDMKRHEIPAPICCGLAVCLIVYTAVLAKPVPTVPLLLFFLFMTFGPIEIDIFGQADWFLISYLFIQYWMPIGLETFMITAVCWLVGLVIYVVLIRDEKGKRWKPFSGMMVPAFPSFALGVTLSIFVRVLVVKQLYLSSF